MVLVRPSGYDCQAPSARGRGRLLFASMINAIRIRTTIESDNLRIPELAGLIGKRVEILVVEDDAASAVAPVPDAASEARASRQRILGSLHGLLHVPDDFDDPLPEDVLRAFEGEG